MKNDCERRTFDDSKDFAVNTSYVRMMRKEMINEYVMISWPPKKGTPVNAGRTDCSEATRGINTVQQIMRGFGIWGFFAAKMEYNSFAAIQLTKQSAMWSAR
jgi:hypothetical protein